MVPGQSEPALDEQIFSAAEGELAGPFEGDSGFYVIRVEGIDEGTTTPLDEAREQIRQTLIAGRQQQVATEFQEGFRDKWVSRTVCDEDLILAPQIDPATGQPSAPSPCSNAPPADAPPCVAGATDTEGCAPVPSTRPSAPQVFEAAGGPLAATPVPTPPWDAGLAALSGGFVPGFAQAPFNQGRAVPALPTGGLTPGLTPIPGQGAPPGVGAPPGAGAPPGTGAAPPGG